MDLFCTGDWDAGSLIYLAHSGNPKETIPNVLLLHHSCLTLNRGKVEVEDDTVLLAGGAQAGGPHLNLSWPAVSQSCSFILVPSVTSMSRAKKSTPTVGSEICNASPV